MIEYKPIQKIEKPDRHSIIIDNTEIGDIWHTKHGWQCQLSKIPALHSCNLYPGAIEDTKEDSIRKAVDEMRKWKESLALAIKWMEDAMGE